MLYHASSFRGFASVLSGVVTLRPGTQNAQGVGVYFSRGAAAVNLSDSCVQGNGVAAIFAVDSTVPKGWYKSKGSAKRARAGKPPVCHSNGADVPLLIKSVTVIDGVAHIDAAFI